MLNLFESFMLFRKRFCFVLGVVGLAAVIPDQGYAQSGYVTNGGEYAPAGYLPGDQINPDVALTATSGFVVWEDNITDGDGEGISGQALDATLSPTFGTFRINQIGAGEQEHPRVAILANGGKAVVWQGGQPSFQHVYARFLTSSNTFTGANDVMVNTDTNHFQDHPAVAALANSNAVVVWDSYGQDYSDGLQGVYAQILSPTGQKILTGDLLVNQFTPNNQRAASVAAFPNGNFIVVWVSEKENSTATFSGGYLVISNGPNMSSGDSVDIYARIFGPTGSPVTGEFKVNTDPLICANPAVAVASDNTFTIVWSEKNVTEIQNSWDVYGRQFSSATNGGGVFVLNSQLYGDQFDPRIASLGTDYMAVWTSLGQDGSQEGVFGQVIRGGAKAGPEFMVNTTVLNSQMNPAIASDNSGRFLAVWSSFEQPTLSMDIMAQRYINTNALLSPPAPPIINALNSYTLSAAWAPLAGFSVDHWNLYVDASTIVSTTNTYWQNESMSSFTNYFLPQSTHSFQLSYVLTDGRQSPLSATNSGTTWGPDLNSDGLPDNWETLYWGGNSANWPTANTVLSIGGLHATALQIFEEGANPTNATTWLVQTITPTPEGYFLNWNTTLGAVYQVQTTTSDTIGWSNLGAPRFAPGTSDSIFLGLSSPVAYYRIMRLTY
jgi:hypothetical protein